MKRACAALICAFCMIALLPAGALAYTLTLDHPDYIAPDWSSNHDAGDRIQLEFYLGTHPKIGEAYYELVDWQEKPNGLDAVEIIKTEYTDTLTKCEIIMPARDVTLSSVWEECFVISYKLFEDGKTKDSYARRMGEKTPAFQLEGKTVPEMIGHRFAGWSPALEDTVTKSVTYVAQWIPLVEVASVGESVQIHYDADIQYFSDIVKVNGKTLEKNTEYTAEPGSTLITLTPQYMNSLPEGITDLNIETGFTIEEDGEERILMIPAHVPLAAPALPQTGDSGDIVLWLGMLTIALAVLVLRRCRTA